MARVSPIIEHVVASSWNKSRPNRRPSFMCQFQFQFSHCMLQHGIVKNRAQDTSLYFSEPGTFLGNFLFHKLRHFRPQKRQITKYHLRNVSQERGCPAYLTSIKTCTSPCRIVVPHLWIFPPFIDTYDLLSKPNGRSSTPCFQRGAFI